MAKKKEAIDDSTAIAAAREGLRGVAPDNHIGDAHTVETTDGVHTVLFTCLTPGYPGWNWVVTVSDGDGGVLGVLETHLLPGDGALLAPDWVPWADRLEEYQRLEAERERDDSESDDDDDDVDDDLDVDDALDGIDIDQLDLDPAGLEIPEEPNDVFDHVDFDDD
jgi:hypothetical protein